MTTYAEIADLVSTRIVNPSAAVLAEIPRLVHVAQLEAERRHGFMAMRGNWMLQTQIGSLLALPGAAAWYPTSGVDTEEYCFLRSRTTEDPFWVEFETLPTLTPVDGTLISLLNFSPADGRLTWNLSGGTTFAQAGFEPGMWIVVSGLSSHAAMRVLEGVPCLIEQIIGANRSIVVRVPDARVASSFESLSQFNSTVRFTGVRSKHTRTHPMKWATQPQINRLYSSPQSGAGTPRHVLEGAPDERGIPTFLVYPYNDTTAYDVVIPCFLHLGNAIDDPPAPEAATWFTNHATEYLVRAATAEAALLEEDYEKAALWRGRADTELATLIREDKRRQPRAQTIGFSSGARGSSATRIPRL